MRPCLPLLALAALAACSVTDDSVPGTCRGVAAYTVGTAKLDTLGQNECERPGDIDGQLYAITLAAQTNFDLTLTPSDFRGVLAIYDSTDTMIWSVADPGTLRMKLYLPAGAYLAVAGRYGQAGGEYTLTSPPAVQNACDPHGRTVPGATIAGTVTDTDCQAPLGFRNDIYAVRLSAGRVTTITTTTANAGRVEVYLEGPNTQIDARNTAANTALPIAFIAPTTGTYRIHVSSSTFPTAYTVQVQ